MNDICLHTIYFRCCSCDNHWQHSDIIMRTEDGGYVNLDSPTEFAKWLNLGAALTCRMSRHLLVPICHVCTPTDLPNSWPTQKKKEVPHVVSKTPLTDKDLERLLSTGLDNS